MLKIHHCNRCGKKWAGRGRVEKPLQCPGCKSVYWNKARVRKVATA